MAKEKEKEKAKESVEATGWSLKVEVAKDGDVTFFTPADAFGNWEERLRLSSEEMEEVAKLWQRYHGSEPRSPALAQVWANSDKNSPRRVRTKEAQAPPHSQALLEALDRLKEQAVKAIQAMVSQNHKEDIMLTQLDSDSENPAFLDLRPQSSDSGPELVILWVNLFTGDPEWLYVFGLGLPNLDTLVGQTEGGEVIEASLKADFSADDLVGLLRQLELRDEK